METLLFGKKGKLSWGGSSWLNSSEEHRLVCKKKGISAVLSRRLRVLKN
jgi:hypothetical protein